MKSGKLARTWTTDTHIGFASKNGFTLVELLVVVMIIAMLVSMVSFAMFRSMQAARGAKTQSLISKLHNVVVRHWDTFETGQPPSNMTVAQWLADEMPDKQSELAGSSVINQSIAAGVNPSLKYPDEEDCTSAQCLYQLALQIADDDLDRINFFSEDEVKDLNDDGSPDIFIDGWGNPISFIREPVGFVDQSDLMNADDVANGIYFPLIYSSGPDKSGGLGASAVGDGTNDHIDNIHNHRMNASLQ